MLDVNALLTRAVIERIDETFWACFGEDHTGHNALAQTTAQGVLRQIATCNTPYHDLEHTVQVVMAGQEILLGRMRKDADLTPRDWLNVTVSLLCHDIGFVRGICRGDRAGLVTGRTPTSTQRLEVGSCDAALMPFHVERGMRYAAEQFAQQPLVDVEAVQRNIERTRFPVPTGGRFQRAADYPGLVRGADLIGQMSDPRYLQKLPALFYEFEENGMNALTGYRTPADLLRALPAFFDSIRRYLEPALRYLQETVRGRQIAAALERNVALAQQASRP